MRSASRIIALFTSPLLLFLSSCSSPTPLPPSTIVTVSPTILTTPVPTSTLPPKIFSLVCESYTEADLAYDYYDFPSFLNDIVTNLNNCVSPATVMDGLRVIDQQGFAFTIDLNQDHIEEIMVGGVLFFLPPEGQTWTEHDSNLVVFYQKNSKYEVKVMFEGSFNGYPELANIIDINGDGINEVIFTIPYGGSGCNEIISAIGWQSNEPIDYFRDVHHNQFVDCPADTNIVDTNNDGTMEIIQKHRGQLINSYGPVEILFQFNTKLNSYNAVP